MRANWVGKSLQRIVSVPEASTWSGLKLCINNGKELPIIYRSFIQHFCLLPSSHHLQRQSEAQFTKYASKLSAYLIRILEIHPYCYIINYNHFSIHFTVYVYNFLVLDRIYFCNRDFIHANHSFYLLKKSVSFPAIHVIPNDWMAVVTALKINDLMHMHISMTEFIGCRRQYTNRIYMNYPRSTIQSEKSVGKW